MVISEIQVFCRVVCTIWRGTVQYVQYVQSVRYLQYVQHVQIVWYVEYLGMCVCITKYGRYM